MERFNGNSSAFHKENLKIYLKLIKKIFLYNKMNQFKMKM